MLLVDKPRATAVSTIVGNGVMFAELNEFFAKELQKDGYSGMEYKPYGSPIEIILRVARPTDVIGDKKTRIKQLTSLVQMRMGLAAGSVAIYVEQIKNRSLCPAIQAEALRDKLGSGMAVRRAVSGTMKSVMEAGAEGVEIIVSGKLRGQRAKSYKVVSGLLVHSGEPSKDYMRHAKSSILLRQGVIGIKVGIMMKWDPTGKTGPSVLFADKITVSDPGDSAREESAEAVEKKGKGHPGINK